MKKNSHNCIRKRTKEILRKPTGQHGKRRCGESSKRRRITTPADKQHNFSQDEEDLILRLHALLGNRWSLIAGRLPGRGEEEVEKHWNSHLKTKLISNTTGNDLNNPDANEAAICRPSSSSSCSCHLHNINDNPVDDDDEARSSRHKPKQQGPTQPSRPLCFRYTKSE